MPADLVADGEPAPLAWQPPVAVKPLAAQVSREATDMAFIGSPLFTNPFASILSSIQLLLGALWVPPLTELSAETPAYRITLSTEGIYRLTATDLAEAGVDPAALDLGQIRLYHLGTEVALYIYDPDADDTLDAEDYLLFYGRAVDSADAKYTGSNVYWLTLSGGNGAPQRMNEIDGTPSGGPPAVEFEATVVHEADELYGRTAPGADGVDRWFFSTYVPGDGWDKGWVPTAGDPIPFTVSLPGSLGSGTVTIAMFDSFDQEHTVDIAINGIDQGSFTWSGVAYHHVTLTDVGLLDGDNTVSLTCTSGVDTILKKCMPLTKQQSNIKEVLRLYWQKL